VLPPAWTLVMSHEFGDDRPAESPAEAPISGTSSSAAEVEELAHEDARATDVRFAAVRHRLSSPFCTPAESPVRSASQR
jgi:hypothetical protein